MAKIDSDTTAELTILLQELMGLQADILMRGITKRRRNKMVKLLDKYFKTIGEENIARSQYWEYWYEG